MNHYKRNLTNPQNNLSISSHLSICNACSKDLHKACICFSVIFNFFLRSQQKNIFQQKKEFLKNAHPSIFYSIFADLSKNVSKIFTKNIFSAEVYSEPSRTSKMELSAKIVNGF